ncbi:TonB-dependent receptor [Kineobactrum salinum]|uniref:TonB-dependent receptor n=1 Tax=Kineobactrum salinum TaxID=2708301 RepID=A0A6C0TZI3_9GAMM|nr:TonB-dependent receptor [Kineobactrum salinum]QIB65242.1 TonB-dependent receptor [Kineobactrum salinum]
MNKRALLTGQFVGVLMASGLPGAATAQDSAPAASDTVLEEIIVTAGRREESLQDVPAAVSVMSPDALKYRGLKQVSDMLDYTPGVTYNSFGGVGRGSISARGVPQPSSTPVFGIYLDDTPLTTNTSFSRGGTVLFDGLLMDIDRVEIIKGPQGTLYGATSVGGMMRYISRDPALQEMRGTVSADISDTASGDLGYTYSGRVSVPVIENTLGLTLSGFYRDTAGYVDQVDPVTGAVIDEDADGGITEGFAADLLFVPTDQLEVRLKYLQQNIDADYYDSVLLEGGSDRAVWGEYSNIDGQGPRFVDYEIYSGSLNYDMGWATLTSSSSYVEYEFGQLQDGTSSFAGLVDQFDNREPGTTTNVDVVLEAGSEKYVQEFRLTSNGNGPLQWIAGLYYADEESFNNQSAQATPAFDLLTISFPADYREYAGFGNITWELNEKFDVTAGARLSRSRIELAYTTSGLLLGTADLVTPEIEDTVDTYLFAARYRPTENLSLYSRIASGYRPAQSNLPILDPATGENIAEPVVDADKAWSYEVGAKGSSARGRLSYDVALWMIDWSEFQTALVLNGVTTDGNARDSLGAYGFEGELTLRPVDALTLVGNVTYTSSELDSDEPQFGGIAGEQFPDLPEWTASLQANYGFPVFDQWQANLGGGLRYVGSSVSAFSGSATQLPVKIDARLITDLDASVSNDRFTFGMFVTNLFDERDVVARTDNIIAGTGVDSRGYFTRPRTIGINARVDF